VTQSLTDLSLYQSVQGLRRGDFSSIELVESYLERIEQIEPVLHSFITRTPETARRRAEEADRRLAVWRKSPGQGLPELLGTPLAVKDVLCVSDVRCTCGSRILEEFVPVYNATAVERLLAAGMCLLGKTNTDEFAMGSSTENSAYGETHNPWDLERVPGGSSGGSAAAVAAHLAPVALGTDTGGSVRHPAAFCGLTGLKPTYGRVSRYGLVAFGSSLDVVGVIGRDAVDVALVYQAIAGRDPLDSTSVAMPVGKLDLFSSIRSAPNASGEIHPKPLAGLRIGVPEEYFVSGLQPEVRASVRLAIQKLEELGGEARAVSLPHTQYALPVYYLIAPAEASANLARYDGIRYGPRANAGSIMEVFTRTRGQKFGAEVKRRIMLGTYALSAGYYDAYYGKAQKVRTLIRQDFDRVFEDVDIITAPVTPTTAFRIGEHRNDPLSMYLEDILTLSANLSGIPALAFPVGFDQDGLPIGMQVMSSHFQEEILFKVAHAYQRVTEWHTRKPDL
jgi:aspartyl-tRNA(Asn)/glutamyl-tRNA(Gln) amidotransferase subunit A